MMKLKKLGLDKPNPCCGRSTCPAVFISENGDFVIVGTDVTTELKKNLPIDSGCASYEKIVKIPRNIMLKAIEEVNANEYN